MASIVAAIAIVGGAVAMASSMGGQTDAPAVPEADVSLGPPGSNPLLPSQEYVGRPAPTTPFETFDGATATFADYQGRPVVVNFFSSTCAPCLQEMPDFESVKQAHGEEVFFLGMNVADSVESGLRIVEATGVTWELGRDPMGVVLSEIGGIGMPTTVVLRSDGTVSSIHTGQLTAAELEARIAEATT